MKACTASCCLPIDAPRSTVLTRRVRRAVYATVKSVRALFGAAEAALSLLVMPLLSRAQRRAGAGSGRSAGDRGRRRQGRHCC